MKRPSNDFLKNYARRLSDHDLELLNSRLEDRLFGDMAECCHIFQRAQDLDRWISTATSPEDFWEMTDMIHAAVKAESARRSVSAK